MVVNTLIKDFHDDTKMPFGKYRGSTLKDVPGSYLLWLADQPEFDKKNPQLFAYIEKNRDIMEKESEGR